MENKERGEEVSYQGISDLFEGMEYSKLSHFQRTVNRVLKVGRINNVVREPVMKARILGCATLCGLQEQA